MTNTNNDKKASNMELKAGTYYKTHDGHKAFVSCKLDNDPFENVLVPYPYIGYIDDIGYAEWDKSGVFKSCAWVADGKNVSHALNIVEEWSEPKKIKATVQVWVTNDGDLFAVSDESTGYANANLFAKARIEVTEGEGL